MGKLFDVIFGARGGMTRKDLRNLTRRDRFSDYLPWIAYDGETEAYHNADGTKGFLWECSPLCFAGEKTLFTLEGLFRLGLPHGSVMQFILHADSHIDPYIEAYRSGKTRASRSFTRPPRSSPLSLRRAWRAWTSSSKPL